MRYTTRNKKKISGYKAQDKKDEERTIEGIITEEEVLEKLVGAKLKCHYCCENMKLLYNISRDPKQWTLDRIDNEQGHNVGNVKISCLECNVKRGTTRMERFKEGRIIRIQKQK